MTFTLQEGKNTADLLKEIGEQRKNLSKQTISSLKATFKKFYKYPSRNFTEEDFNSNGIKNYHFVYQMCRDIIEFTTPLAQNALQSAAVQAVDFILTTESNAVKIAAPGLTDTNYSLTSNARTPSLATLAAFHNQEMRMIIESKSVAPKRLVKTKDIASFFAATPVAAPMPVPAPRLLPAPVAASASASFAMPMPVPAPRPLPAPVSASASTSFAMLMPAPAPRPLPAPVSASASFAAPMPVPAPMPVAATHAPMYQAIAAELTAEEERMANTGIPKIPSPKLVTANLQPQAALVVQPLAAATITHKRKSEEVVSTTASFTSPVPTKASKPGSSAASGSTSSSTTKELSMEEKRALKTKENNAKAAVGARSLTNYFGSPALKVTTPLAMHTPQPIKEEFEDEDIKDAIKRSLEIADASHSTPSTEVVFGMVDLSNDDDSFGQYPLPPATSAGLGAPASGVALAAAPRPSSPPPVKSTGSVTVHSPNRGPRPVPAPVPALLTQAGTRYSSAVRAPFKAPASALQSAASASK